MTTSVAKAVKGPFSGPYGQTALVFQGGGAPYRPLAEAGCAPDWHSGISIGAINTAIHRGERARHAAPSPARHFAS
jgi:predicted acylesterase/phospholipase RssA